MSESPQNNQPPPSVSIKEAFLFWLKLGFISFGGPAGQIAIMHEELVERRRWISERRFLHALNYCMLLPGPEAQQLATYLGWLMHRTTGGIIAGLLFILPSLVLLILLSWVYLRFGQLPAVSAVLYGIKSAVVAIVLFAAYRIGSRALKNAVLWTLAALAFGAIFVLHAPFPLIVLIAALIGALGGRFTPQYFAVGGGHGATKHSFGKALIDDDTPIPDHAQFRWSRLLMIVGIGLLLWGSVMGFLCAQYGWNGALTQMGWFFTKAALLTFGGAYAVLPYVYQGAVEHFHWLSATQMMDGLALGETTPGPLIMIVTFVGFLGGWNALPLGADSALITGVIAAVVVTYFTFLPSFLFILAGAPLIESTHGNLKFTAPLSAITAAVVGVIVNLAVFFAGHILFPQGVTGAFDAVAALITVLASLALFRYKVGIIPVIAGCGAAGWLSSLLLA
ncbi:MAG: chromate efflux transporter [Methylococcales bacterium]|nr:chromate efflux transporter [Methylococcales bacterium]MDP3839688.1 chromate efflux transporter [Methylococcales bacterium]